MSYEGYVEFISEKGYHTVCDCYSDEPTEINGDPIVWRHSVDQTNGYGEERKYALSSGEPLEEFYYDEDAPKEQIGWDDVWHTDHHGNQYATKKLKYKPLAGWKKISE